MELETEKNQEVENKESTLSQDLHGFTHVDESLLSSVSGRNQPNYERGHPLFAGLWWQSICGTLVVI